MHPQAVIKTLPRRTKTPASLPPKQEWAQKMLLTPFQIRREINNRSLYEFVKYFWSEVSGDEFKPNWHIEYLCKELEVIAERVAKKLPKEYDLVINIPPGMTKTIVCSIAFPAWCWTKWFWMRFITGGYSGALSLESAEYSRDLIRSERFKAIYPELEIKEDKDVKSNFKIVKKDFHYVGRNPRLINGGNRFSTSVGGTLTGFHGHIQIVDDPLDPNRAVSEVELKKANRWCDQTLSTRKTDKKVTPLILIMQRLHEDDPSGHLLKKKNKRIRHICLPGEITHYREFVSPPELVKMYQDGMLDLERLGPAELQEMEADLGQYGYAGQVGQNPVPPGGGMFQVDHFIVLNVMPSRTNIVQSVRYWDKAGSEGKGAWTVGVKMSKFQNGRFIIEDCRRGQWASHERENIIRETAVADGSEVRVVVEQEPGSGGKESAEGTIRNLAGFSAHADRPTGDKVYRADPYSVQVNSGNVLVVRGDWNQVFIEEHRNFPFGTYKDQVDASSGAFNTLAGKRQVRMLERRHR